MEGTQVGSYRLLSLLGQGAMGEVWRAHDTATGRDVAIKLLPLDLSGDPKFSRRFHHEARIVAALDSPHVIPVHRFGELDGRLFLDMRLIQGRDLQTVLAEGPLDPERAIGIVEQVAEGLHAAHTAGLIHRDVNPTNVLLDGDDVAYVIDFGLTAELARYPAPEEANGVPTDARADVYSLACMLYECLAGAEPFPGDHPPQPISSTNHHVSEQLDAVVAKGMAERQSDRYPGTLKFAAAARHALSPTEPSPAEGPLAAVRPPTKKRSNFLSRRGWTRRKIMIAALASIGVLAMVATTAAAILMPFVLKQDTGSAPRSATLPTTTTPAVYIAPLSIRPVIQALVAQPGECDPGPPPPPTPPGEPLKTCDVERKAVYELGPEALTLTLTGATAVKLPMSQFLAVQVVMNTDSSARFAQYTGSQLGKQVAFVRDGMVLAAPAISQPIAGESLQLSGEMTAETAETIARMLREGT